MEKEALQAWIEVTIGAESWRNVAERLHTTHSTIQRRLRNYEADAIIEIAREYGANPLTGLMAAGVITQSDVTDIAGNIAVADFTDQDLARLLLQRLEDREVLERQQAIDNGAMEARPRTELRALPDDGVVRDWDDSIPHAADSSPDEDLLREEEGEGPID